MLVKELQRPTNPEYNIISYRNASSKNQSGDRRWTADGPLARLIMVEPKASHLKYPGDRMYRMRYSAAHGDRKVIHVSGIVSSNPPRQAEQL